MDSIKNAVFIGCMCAILISAVQIISPDRFKKEFRIICGLVMIICITVQISGFDIDYNIPDFEDNKTVQALDYSYKSNIIDITEERLEDKVKTLLSEKNIMVENICIDCSIDEYNCVRVDKVTVYCEDDPVNEDRVRIYAELSDLLPETEIEVTKNWQQ